MQIHQLKPKPGVRSKKRVGRGDKTAGRGTKGQKSRAGHKIRPAIRDLLKKLPKLRGYRFRSFRRRPTVIRFALLEQHFADGDSIDPDRLLERGLIRRMKGRVPPVKILGPGGGAKHFTFSNVTLSRSIARAGGERSRRAVTRAESV